MFGSGLVDLSHLGRHGAGLKEFSAFPEGGVDTEYLTRLPELRDLMVGTEGRTDIGFVSRLPRLDRLALVGLEEVRDYTPLLTQTALDDMWLHRCTQLTEVEHLPLSERLRGLSLVYSALRCDLAEVLARAPRLDSLNLSHCSWATDLGPLSALRLTRLYLNGLDSFTDPDSLRGQSELIQLNAEATPLRDLGPLAELSKLQYLYLNRCEAITDLSPLAPLTALRRLHLRGARPGLDLAPLAARRKLTITIQPGQYVRSREIFTGKLLEID